MQRFFRTAKEGGLVAASLLCAAFVALLFFAPAFAPGERYELYTGTSSALCLETDCPLLDKLRLGGVRGESVRYTGDLAEEIAEQFRGELLFTEEACGVKNYYLYSPFLGEGILLNGRLVNLHIAVNGEQTAAGTPLIFGGF